MTIGTRERLSDHPRMPRVGTKLANRYEVLDLIGEGGFAVVYRARDTHLGGLVALKVLEPSKSMDQAFTKRFEQEINLVRELRHHNSIKIWDAGQTDWGCLYYAMELVEGEELATLVKRTKGLSVERVVRIIGQVLRSLGEAHRAGIIHRDLKPGNIMVCQLEDEPDYVKVLDFGIAKARSEKLTKVKTQTGMVMCTPNYAAPELLRNQDIVPATDLYALGLIMAEMVTGEQAVQAHSLVDIITIQVSPGPLTLDPRLLQMPIGRVIAKATAKNIAERYQSATEMLADLRALGAPPPSVMPVPPTPGIGVPDSIAREQTTNLSHDSGLVPAKSRPAASKAIVLMFAVVFVLCIGLVALLVLPRLGDEETGTDDTGAASVESETGPTEPVATEESGVTGTHTGDEVAVDPAPPEVSEPSDPTPQEVALTNPSPEVAVPVAEPEPSPPEPTPEATIEASDSTPTQTTPAEEESPIEEVSADAVDPVEPVVVPADEVEQLDVASAVATGVRFNLTSDPSRVRIYIDGEQVGRTPFDETHTFDNETVEVTLRKTDYHTARYTVTVSDGVFERHVRLRRVETEPAAAPSFEELPLDF